MTLEVIDRFLAKVQVQPDGCWVWTAALRDGYPYGVFCFDGKTYRAHRFSYLLYRGEIPEGQHVCHSCDNPTCVNPHHLFLGTQSDNIQDCLEKGRFNHGTRGRPKDSCPVGHPYTPENSYSRPGVSGRHCRECRRQRSQGRRARRREV